MSRLPILLLPLLLCVRLEADVRQVPPSLPGTVTQQIGKTTVRVTYSRPNAQGREIFGGLVPFGTVWRTGANEATTFACDTDLLLGGEPVAAGRYALFTIPGPETWTVILNREPDQFGAFKYDPAKDLLRVTAPVLRLADPVETFEIGFSAVVRNAARLDLRWQHVRISVPLEVSEAGIAAIIRAEIERDLVAGAKRTWDNYGEAARFLVARGEDLAQAAAWFAEACRLNPAAYWLQYERAKALSQIGRLDEARDAVRAGMAAAGDDAAGRGWGEALLAELATAAAAD